MKWILNICISLAVKYILQPVLNKTNKMIFVPSLYQYFPEHLPDEPVHEISNNVVCATSKASDQPAHMRSLIRAFACCLSIL